MVPSQHKKKVYVPLHELQETAGLNESQQAAWTERRNLMRLPLDKLMMTDVMVSDHIAARWHPADVFARSGTTDKSCLVIGDVKCRKDPSTKYDEWMTDSSKVEGIRRWRDALPEEKRQQARVMLINFFSDDVAYFWDLDNPPHRQEMRLLPHKDGDGPWYRKMKQVNFYHVDKAMRVEL